ncbi:MAG: hypothetical protein ACLRPV_06300 [Lacrimispora saccharolytica]
MNFQTRASTNKRSERRQGTCAGVCSYMSPVRVLITVLRQTIRRSCRSDLPP